MASIQTVKISDLDETTLDAEKDFIEVSRDNGDTTFDSFKVPASGLGGGGGVEVGQSLLQIAAQPLGADYLRLDGGSHPKASYPLIEGFFPTASDWGLGGSTDNGTPAESNEVGAIVLSNDASKLYVSSNGSGAVTVYNTSDWSVITTIPINNGWTTIFEPTRMIISQDGSRIVLGVGTDAASSSKVTVIDTASDTVITHIPDSEAVKSEAQVNLFDINTAGNKVVFRSLTSGTNIKVYNIDTANIDLSFTAPENCFSLAFKPDNDFILTGFQTSISLYSDLGILQVGPVAAGIFSRLFSTSKTSDYFFVSETDRIKKVSFSDLSTISEHLSTGRHSISESGTGDYLAVGSNDPGLNYFFVLYEPDMSLVSGFPGATGQVWDTTISKNDFRMAYGWDVSPYFNSVDQLGSTSNFILPDISSPDLAFEYRIKAQ